MSSASASAVPQPGGTSTALLLLTYKAPWLLKHSFLCALPPTLRQQWATTYTRLSTVTPSPTLLITLQFPLDDDKESGPPYSVGRKDDPNKLYQELLGEQWELVYDTAVSKDETREEEYHEGRERLAVWRRK